MGSGVLKCVARGSAIRLPMMLADVIAAAAIANWRRVNMVISRVASSTTYCTRGRYVSAPITRTPSGSPRPLARMPPRPLQFAYELTNLNLGELVGLAAQRGRPVHASKRPAISFIFRFQISSSLQAMQHRIKCSRAESVAVSGKFMDHPLPIKRLLRCVMQDMQPNKAF
jgi:hypothetical protein